MTGCDWARIASLRWSGVGGAEEGGGRAAFFDEVGGGAEDLFECVDGGEAYFEGAEREGVFECGAEGVECALGFGCVEPGEEVGDGGICLVGEGAEVAIEGNVDLE